MNIYDVKLTYKIVREGVELPKVDTPASVCEYMKGAFDHAPEQEQFWVIMLSRRLRPKGRHLVTLGTQTSSLVHPREVFRAAVHAGACAIVCVHNHPSGDPTPSTADLQVTRQLRQAAQTLDIDLVDHVIIGRREDDPKALGYYSFRESGVL